MKKITILAVCLLISLANASLEVNQKHVFAGEDFTVLLKVEEPEEQYVRIKMGEQEKEVYIPHQESFSVNATLKAPEPGEYEITSKYGNTKVVVEEPLLIIKKAELEKTEVSAGQNSALNFKIVNKGDYMVYNTKYGIEAIKNPGFFEFDATPQEMGNLKSKEEKEFTEVIHAEENAEGTTTILLTVEYEFDGEKHYRKEQRELTVKGTPILDVVMLILIFAAAIIILVEIASILTKKRSD